MPYISAMHEGGAMRAAKIDIEVNVIQKGDAKGLPELFKSATSEANKFTRALVKMNSATESVAKNFVALNHSLSRFTRMVRNDPGIEKLAKNMRSISRDSRATSKVLGKTGEGGGMGEGGIGGILGGKLGGLGALAGVAAAAAAISAAYKAGVGFIEKLSADSAKLLSLLESYEDKKAKGLGVDEERLARLRDMKGTMESVAEIGQMLELRDELFLKGMINASGGADEFKEKLATIRDIIIDVEALVISITSTVTSKLMDGVIALADACKSISEFIKGISDSIADAVAGMRSLLGRPEYDVDKGSYYKNQLQASKDELARLESSPLAYGEMPFARDAKISRAREKVEKYEGLVAKAEANGGRSDGSIASTFQEIRNALRNHKYEPPVKSGTNDTGPGKGADKHTRALDRNTAALGRTSDRFADFKGFADIARGTFVRTGGYSSPTIPKTASHGVNSAYGASLSAERGDSSSARSSKPATDLGGSSNTSAPTSYTYTINMDLNIESFDKALVKRFVDDFVTELNGQLQAGSARGVGQ